MSVIIKLDDQKVTLLEEYVDLFTKIKSTDFELKGCSVSVFNKIVEFAELYQGLTKTEKNNYKNPPKLLQYKHESAWFYEYFRMNVEDLVMLINSCYVLGFDVLMQIACFYISKNIEGKSREEICEIFELNLPDENTELRSTKENW
jgi:hypothetical protein